MYQNHRLVLLIQAALFLIPRCILANETTVNIVIHGTFASSADWCKPGGDFYDMLRHNVMIRNEKLMPYRWSGDLSHEERIDGARNLVESLLTYPTDTEFVIIAHSHGGNVATLASKMLSNPFRKLLTGMADLNLEKLMDDLYTEVFGNEADDKRAPALVRAIRNDRTEATAQDYCNAIKALFRHYRPDDDIAEVRPAVRSMLLSHEQSPAEIGSKESIKRKLFKACLSVAESFEKYEKRNLQTRTYRSEKPEHKKQRVWIKKLYLLGTPIDMGRYAPNMSTIGWVYNLYSKGDKIQPVLGMYKRLIPDHKRVVNFRVEIEDSSWFSDNPSHSELHDWIVAQNLLFIPEDLAKDKVDGFEKYTSEKNGKLFFDVDTLKVTYTPDKRSTKEREKREEERPVTYTW